MKIQRTIILTLLILFLPLFLIQAQTSAPRAVLVFAEDETLVEVTDTEGNALDVYLGMDIPAGSSLWTGDTSAELQLEPSGSIIKVAQNTLMSVDSLQNGTTGSNDISVKSGKIRAIVARITGQEDSYNFFSRNTVCGIRGTDFLLDANDTLAVADGLVDFTKSATSETLQVSAGNMVRGASDVFSLTPLSTADMNRLFSSVQFVQLDPTDVPGHTASAATTEETTVEQEDEALEETSDESTEEAVEETAEESQSSSSSFDSGSAALTTEPTTSEESTTSDEATGEDPIMKILGGVLGMEVGSFTVDGVTYAKLLFEPTFQLGKLQASLYLPFIYSEDLFDPNDWYKPEGNNEWSFGTDQEETLDMVSDAFGDLFLKIRYLKWGEQRDPFYFAFGNYSGVRLGHGIIMNNYENNSEFPAVRKVGLNMGAYREKMDFELVGEDFSSPLEQVIAARVAFPLAGPLSLGFSGATDLDPTQDLDSDTDSAYIDRNPLVVNFGLDLDFPVMERSIMTILFYADGASLLPFDEGNPQTDFLIDDDGVPRNYGTAVGVMGNILIIDYQLEYQYATGIFHHGYYNSTYDKLRGDRIKEILDYLDSPTDEEPSQGIYGTAGFTLADLLYFSAGYNWLWSSEGADLDNDYLEMTLSINPDVIPVVGVYGSIGYSRTGLAAAIADQEVSFIDDKTTFMGEVVYPVSDYLDLALVMASTLSRDDDGDIIYDSNGNAEAEYSISLDVRLSY